jgi:hypothetical protein
MVDGSLFFGMTTNRMDMNKIINSLLTCVFSTVIISTAAAQNNPDELIVCGSDEVFVLDMSIIEDGLPKKVWSWTAAGRTEIPATIRSQFNTIDECKPVNQGHRILITSSGGGVALVERNNGEVIFYASLPNAHSAELLPNNRLAVAVSGHSQGNRLVIYDLVSPNNELLSDSLPSGHGVVWDQKRQLLWALADKQLKVYKLIEWDSSTPSILLYKIYKLPEGGGHDLYPVPGSSSMTVTTKNHCWIFDRDNASFVLHPLLSEKRSVKSISISLISNQLVYIQADTSWWSENLRFLVPEKNIYYKNQHFYKARWNVISN